MEARKRHHWSVTLQRNDGEIVTRDFKAYWNPAAEDALEAAGIGAKVEAWAESKKRYEFAPIAVKAVS